MLFCYALLHVVLHWLFCTDSHCSALIHVVLHWFMLFCTDSCCFAPIHLVLHTHSCIHSFSVLQHYILFSTVHHPAPCEQHHPIPCSTTRLPPSASQPLPLHSPHHRDTSSEWAPAAPPGWSGGECEHGAAPQGPLSAPRTCLPCSAARMWGGSGATARAVPACPVETCRHNNVVREFSFWRHPKFVETLKIS